MVKDKCTYMFQHKTTVAGFSNVICTDVLGSFEATSL